jgi:hypothetical protein
MTTDPYQYLTASGVIVPDTSEILAGVQTTYQDVFGADLIVTPDTPQGVLITAETEAEVSTVNNNAAIANQINPNIAGGVFLDAIIALTNPAGRTSATQTLVPNVTLTGIAGTIIAEGTQAKTSTGDLFSSLSSITLDGSGNGIVDFASISTGAIPCSINALNTIVTSILGWETVTNPTAGILGSSTQSDQAARAYRTNTLGFQGVALPVAESSSVLSISGVTSLTYIENYNSEPVGMIISVTAGTLAGIYSMTTSGDVAPEIIVDTTAMNFSLSNQTLPSPNPWPIALYTTSANITLSGLSTQGGGNWPGSLTGGNIILVKNQSTASQNGVWVAAAGAWSRQAYNTSATTILGSISGISLTANAVYNCIDGGADVDIAAAILENKSSGAPWNGGTSVSIIEPASNQVYSVKFDRPTVIPVLIRVTASNGSTANIIQAVLDYAAGLINGLKGFVIGNDVSPFEIAGAIMSEYPGYFISKIEVSLESSVSYSTTTIPIAINQIAYTQFSYVTVIIS